jgi:hypothetical protein
MLGRRRQHVTAVTGAQVERDPRVAGRGRSDEAVVKRVERAAYDYADHEETLARRPRPTAGHDPIVGRLEVALEQEPFVLRVEDGGLVVLARERLDGV